MNTESAQLDEMLECIERDHEGVPWMVRRDLAGKLGSAMAKPAHRETAFRLAKLLSEDSKWEVRKEIAILLSSLPDSEFTQLAARLTEDANGFVRKAAERSFHHRRRGIDNRRRDGFPQFLSEVRTISEIHGDRIARKVQRLAEHLYDQMAGAAVHELRGILTPLKATAVKLPAKLDALDLDALHGDFQTIVKRIDLLERFVNDMRAYSEPVPAERANENIGEVIAEVLQIAIQHVAGNGDDADAVVVKTDVPQQASFPIARHYILAALRNVLVNAFQAILVRPINDTQGQISIVVKVVRDTEAQFIIQDNGVGISDSDLSELRAFVPGRISRKGMGTGFGLPIAQRYIEAHGGTLFLESVEGTGTTVSIILPLQGLWEAGK